MKLGIDVGGSFIKAAAVGDGGNLLSRAMERTANVASAVPAIARRTAELSGEDVRAVCLTGVGSALAPSEILGLPVIRVPEFQAIADGGLYGMDLREAVVASMGTGTALVYSSEGAARHLGGSGVGGGTLEGLSRLLLGTDDFTEIDLLSARGALRDVDLLIGDVATEAIPGLPEHTTAANLAKLCRASEPADVAAGILNLIFQTVGTLAAFACMRYGVGDVVLTGSMAGFSRAPELFEGLTGLYGTRFTVPEHPAFRTAMGAALTGGR